MVATPLWNFISYKYSLSRYVPFLIFPLNAVKGDAMASGVRSSYSYLVFHAPVLRRDVKSFVPGIGFFKVLVSRPPVPHPLFTTIIICIVNSPHHCLSTAYSHNPSLAGYCVSQTHETFILALGFST